MALESGEAALFPRSWEAEGAHAGAFSPHSCGDGGEGNRDACSLLESDVIWDLPKRLSAGILSSPYGHLYYEAYLGEIYRRSDSVLLERRAFLLEAISPLSNSLGVTPSFAPPFTTLARLEAATPTGNRAIARFVMKVGKSAHS